MQKISNCRNCGAACGVILEVENNRILSVKGDKENPASEGFFCIKGQMAAELHHDLERRLTHCLKRGPDDKFHFIDKYEAVEEIAERLKDILNRHGPRALASYFGTPMYPDSVGKPLVKSLMASIGAPAIFTSMTVDQSSKWVASGRMGAWANGKPVCTETDVILLSGTNPPVSHQGYPLNPFPTTNTVGHIRASKKQGTRIIVIDPRRTEMARYADLFIQPKPGHDAEIFAALLRLILTVGGEEKAFVDRWTVNIDRLRTAVEPFTPEKVAASAGVAAEQLEEAARWLIEARKPGIGTGTGGDMAQFSNIAAHLAEALTALVGGYIRAGEKIPNPGVFLARPEEEMVFPPNRTWEHAPYCASDARFGKIMGEFPSSILPDEILDGGKEAIHALFVIGGNPMAALCQPDRTKRALSELDLLVAVEPRIGSATAQLADYVIAPTLQYERTEVSAFYDIMFPLPFVHHTPKLIDAPDQTMDEMEFVWLLARKLGIQLTLKYLPFGVSFDAVPGGLALDMENMPTRESLIEWLVAQTAVSIETLKANPHGYVMNVEKILREASQDTGARLDLCTPDVFEEINAVAAAMELEHISEGRRYRLSVRRLLESLNSGFHQNPETRRRHDINKLYLHPGDLAQLGVHEEEAVRVRSDDGEVIGYAKSDPSMKPGVVSMSHCWGTTGEADPLNLNGAHTGILISLQSELQSINRMPRQSGVPVDLEPLGFTLTEARERTLAATDQTGA